MHLSHLLLALALCASTLAGGCQGCRSNEPHTGQDAAAAPTLRLYLLSDLAGALEPCGCTKGQLGGLDHLAAYIQDQQASAPDSVVLAAGPLLHADAKLTGDQAGQARWKAEAVAASMKAIGLGAWAPGYNDWADGAEALAKLTAEAGAGMLGVGVKPLTASKLITLGGAKVGVIGVSLPSDASGAAPEGVELPNAAAVTALVEEEVARLQQQGARLLVVLAAMQRGAALRLAEAVPSIHVLLIGRPISISHANTKQPPPERIGNTLVVETANHGQGLAVLDVRLVEGADPVVLADADGVEKAAEIAELSARIRELELRLASWRKAGNVAEADLQAREAELEKMRAQRDHLDVPAAAPSGSFFRYRVQEVSEPLGKSKAVAERMRAYYARVNQHNKEAFADRTPPPAAPGQASYLGVEACVKCHGAAYEVWRKTRHADAYQSLARDQKEYNLDCVGCHVTGYQKPGGSTVTHNELLRGVQCEVCHGPGSLHAEDTKDRALIVSSPGTKICSDRCHHPPHVEGFDVKDKIGLILGRGHGGGWPPR